MRHRNLLCLSPYSILPGAARFSRGWDALLPLLAHADVVGFAPAVAHRRPSSTVPGVFHDALRRQVQRFNETSLISTGV